MAHAVMFHYRPGDDVVRRTPPLTKLALATAFAAWTALCPDWGLGVSFLLLATIWFLARLPAMETLRVAAPVSLLFVLTALVPLFHATDPGVFWKGSLRTFRYASLFWAGHILTSTTSPASLARTLTRLLFWVGERRAREAGALASLAIGSIPGILDRAGQIKDAALLRGWSPKRRPLAIVALWTIPLLRILLERGVWTAWSMELRGWGSRRDGPR